MTNKATKYGLMIIAAVLLVAMVFAGAASASWNVMYHYDTVDSLDPVTVAVDNEATAYGNQWAYQPGKVMVGWAIAPDYNDVKYTAGATIPAQSAGSTLDLYLVVENNMQFAGSGSSANPYQISSTDDLKNLSANVNSGECYIGACFSLEADELDFAYDSFWPIGNKSVCYFQGNFDGKYHVIKNMTIATGANSGLFGYVKNADIANILLWNIKNYQSTSTNNVSILAGAYEVDDSNSHSIKNIELDNVSIHQGANWVGFIIGRLDTHQYSLYIGNCTIVRSENNRTMAKDTYSGGRGGIIGASYGSMLIVSDCGIKNSIIKSTTTVGKTGMNCGGILGSANDATQKFYFNNCSVMGCEITADTNTGGLIGCINRCTYIEVTDVTVRDSVITAAPGSGAGGIAGGCTLPNNDDSVFTRCNVINCTVIGGKTSSLGIGGLIGYTTTGNATVKGCLVEDVTLDSITGGVGGFIGFPCTGIGRLTFGTGNSLGGTNLLTGVSDVHAIVGRTNSVAKVVGEEGVAILTTPIITTTGTAVSFDRNGGVGGTGKIYLTTNVSAVGTALSITAPTYTGYTFSGWNISNTDTMLIGTDMKLKQYVVVGSVEYTNDTVWCFTDPYLTVAASWTANTSTVRFDSNNVTGVVTKDQVFTYDVAAALEKNTFTNTSEYVFGTWNTVADGSGTMYSDGAVVKNLTSINNDVVMLYAQWAKNETPVNGEIVFTEKKTPVTKVNVTHSGIIGMATFLENASIDLPAESAGYYVTQAGPQFNLNITEGSVGAVGNYTEVYFNVTDAELTAHSAQPADIRLAHFNSGSSTWDKFITPTYLGKVADNHTFSAKVDAYSIFSTVILTAIPQQYTPSSSSKQTGSTVILQEGQVAPTAYATATPTLAPTAAPTEKPATPTVIATEKPTTQATQQSPAPVVGLIAGLGAAALVLTRMRK